MLNICLFNPVCTYNLSRLTHIYVHTHTHSNTHHTILLTHTYTHRHALTHTHTALSCIGHTLRLSPCCLAAQSNPIQYSRHVFCNLEPPHEVRVSLWHQTYHKQRLRFSDAAGNLPRPLQNIGGRRQRVSSLIRTHAHTAHRHIHKGDDPLSICVP